MQQKFDSLLLNNEALLNKINQLEKDNEVLRNSSPTMFFSPQHKHSDIVISNSGKRISFSGSTGHRSILGDKPLVKGGVYKWKVRYQSSGDYCVVIGIVLLKNFNSSSHPSGMTNSKYIWDSSKENLSGSFSKWKTGDVLELTADMRNNTFSIKEINSGYINVITNFDDVDDVYYPFFYIYDSSHVIEIVD
ncbi:hypothetical protein GEMRC1_000599 [Eukaryota sp. GEM-RC1]